MSLDIGDTLLTTSFMDGPIHCQAGDCFAAVLVSTST